MKNLKHTTESGERLDYLDSVRGIAALVVIGGHYFWSFGAPQAFLTWFSKPFISLFYDGKAAVAIFFVLSGLVLSLRPVRIYGNHYTLKKEYIPFVLHRAGRLLLPYWAVLLLSYAVRRFLYSFSPVIFGGTPYFLELWKNPATLSLHTQWMFASVWLVPQAWTLNIEWWCSLLLPLMLLVANDGLIYLAGFTLACLIFMAQYGMLKRST